MSQIVKVVEDILEKSEPTSATKKLNDERRRMFFENAESNSTKESPQDHQEVIVPTSAECEEQEEPENCVKVERPPRRKEREIPSTVSQQEKENIPEESAANSKKSCIIS